MPKFVLLWTDAAIWLMLAAAIGYIALVRRRPNLVNTWRKVFAYAPALASSVVLALGILTSAGGYLPYVFLGSLVFESFFGIPGLGAYVIEAIGKQDFAIVRTMVFVGSLLYIASYVLIDIAYSWVDPRVRLG